MLRLSTTGMAVAAAAIAMASADPVAADKHRAVPSPAGFLVDGDTTYAFDTAAGTALVSVELEITAANKPRAMLPLSLPEAASLPIATDGDGRRLDVVRRPLEEENGFVPNEIDLVEPLDAGETRRISLSFAISEGTSEAGDLVVNPAAIAVTPILFGDADRASLRVELPAGFTSVLPGRSMSRSVSEEGTTLSAERIARPDAFSVRIEAENIAALVYHEFTTTDGATFSIFNWPGDTGWLRDIESAIKTSAPLVLEVFGRPLPQDFRLTVQRSLILDTRDYHGLYDPNTRTIFLTDRPTAVELNSLLIHELAHTWANGEFFAEPWMWEGFAMHSELVYANQRYAEPAVDEPGRTPLRTWSYFDLAADDPAIGYGYGTSAHVVSTIADEIGTDAMHRVIDAAIDGTAAYDGAAVRPDRADWRRLLDLFEEVGGSRRAPELFAEYVATPEDALLLDARTLARERLSELRTTYPRWTPPAELLNRLEEWDFATALSQLDDAEAALAAAATTTQPTGTTVPSVEHDETSGSNTPALASLVAFAALVLVGIAVWTRRRRPRPPAPQPDDDEAGSGGG